VDRSSSKIIVWVVVGIVTVCLLLVCCAVVAGLAWFVFQGSGASTSPIPAGGLQVGDAAPDFTLVMLNGERTTLSDYHGKPVLLNFWATWCQYCVEEMPVIQERYLLDSTAFTVLAIDEGEPLEDVVDFVVQEGYAFPVLIDLDYQVGDQYFLDGYPISFFVDGDGLIRYIVNGMMAEADMEAGMQSVGVGQ
jgi:peroxiredoxin